MAVRYNTKTGKTEIEFCVKGLYKEDELAVAVKKELEKALKEHGVMEEGDSLTLLTYPEGEAILHDEFTGKPSTFFGEYGVYREGKLVKRVLVQAEIGTSLKGGLYGLDACRVKEIIPEV